MDVNNLITLLPVKLVTDKNTLNKEITGVYCGDLLSLVMANAKEGNIWITIQGHINIVAVASLIGLTAIIVVEGNEVEEEVVQKANEEGVAILTTKHSSYEIASLCAKNLTF